MKEAADALLHFKWKFVHVEGRGDVAGEVPMTMCESSVVRSDGG